MSTTRMRNPRAFDGCAKETHRPEGRAWHLLAFLLAILFLAPCNVWAQATAKDDAYVTSASSSTNNGSSTSLVVQTGGSNSYIRFDLSRIPTGAAPGAVTSSMVQKATVRLFVTAVTANGTFDVMEVGGTSSLQNWSESTITYTSQSSYGVTRTLATGVTVSYPTPNSKNQYIIVDITPAVKDWLDNLNGAGGQYNNGIVLKPSTGSSISAAFSSKEDTTSSHDPELNIVWEPSSSQIVGQINPMTQIGPGTAPINVSGYSATLMSTVPCPSGYATGISITGVAQGCTYPLFSQLGGTDSATSHLVYNNQNNNFTAGFKQTFAASGAVAGLNIAGVGNDPSGAVSGDLWFNLTAGRLNFRKDNTVTGIKSLAYVDDISGIQTTAQAYTDTKVGAEAAARIAGDAATLSSASAHADAGDAATLSSANAHSDAAVLAESVSRAAADAVTLTSANTYTDAEKTRAMAAEALKANLAGGNTFTGGSQVLAPSNTGYASLNVPNSSTTPTTPGVGDIWLVNTDPHLNFRDMNNATQMLAFFSDITAANSNTLLSANGYTDTKVAAEATARTAGDAATLTSANAHADTGDAATLSSANAHSDAAVLAESVSRAAADAATLTSANTYTDGQVATINASLAGKANLTGGNSFTGDQNIAGSSSITGNATVKGLLSVPASAPGNSQPSNGFQLNATDNTGTTQSAQLRTLADGSLSFEFGPTTGPIAEKLSIAPTGLVTFAPGQTFPGTNNGTVTQVDTGAGLTGGPISTTGTISIANAGVTNAMLQNSSIGVVAGTGIGVSGTSSLGGSFTIANTGVLSFNGRNGLVTPLANDYSFAQLSGTDSPTSNLVYNNQANTYTTGSKQTFKASAALAGLSFDSGTANDPTTLATGDTWFNSTASHLKFFDGTTTKTLAFTTDIAAGTVTGTGLNSGQLIVGAGGSSIGAGNLTGEVTTSGTTATTLAATISSAHTFNNAANSFSGSGAGLSNLTAVNISAGTAGINITGSASTITGSISGAQVTGNIAGNAANVTGTIAIANGGTGATSAANARTNLGAAASGANADITSMTAVTSITSTGTLTINGNGSAGDVTINGGDATGSGNGGDVVLSPGAGHGSGNPGQIKIPGTTSGTVSIIPQAVAGTPTLTLPNVSGTFAVSAASPLVLNTTTGALTCPTCGTGSGTVTSVTASSPLASSGGTAPNISLTGSVAIANGGTGQTTAAAARTALGAAASGANGDITSLTALTSVTSAVTMNNASNSFTGNHSGNGAGLTNLTAANISAGTAGINITGTAATATLAGNVTGTVAAANGGTGQTSYTDGQLLIGNTATGGLSKATLTAGSNVTITNGNGSITIAATAPSGSTYLAGASGGSVSAGATVFTSLAAQNATESNVQQLFPITATFTKFSCFGPKPTAGTSDVFTLRRNGANVAGATCTIPSGGTSVVTVSVSVTLNAGDLIDVQVANGNAAGGVTWALAP